MKWIFMANSRTPDDMVNIEEFVGVGFRIPENENYKPAIIFTHTAREAIFEFQYDDIESMEKDQFFLYGLLKPKIASDES